jgi:hypothetical protein
LNSAIEEKELENFNEGRGGRVRCEGVRGLQEKQAAATEEGSMCTGMTV